MSNYDDLVEFRNKLTNETDYVIFEEDCQMLDRILDDLEQKDQRIAELESEVEQLKQKNEELEECYSLYEELLGNKGTEADNINLKNDIENLKHKNFGWLRIQNLEKEIERLKTELAEKDKQLQNAIVPKFKIGDEVWHYNGIGYIYSGIITKTKIINNKKIQYSIIGTDNQLHTKNESDLSLTKAEAEKKLKELKGEE